MDVSLSPDMRPAEKEMAGGAIILKDWAVPVPLLVAGTKPLPQLISTTAPASAVNSMVGFGSGVAGIQKSPPLTRVVS